jgi:hypothetical protein
MVYVLVENGIVTHKRPTPKEGFIEAPDYVAPGYLYDKKDFFAPDTNPTSEELEKETRAKRDRLLADSDWVTIRATDTGTAVPTEWQTYRQALRDLPQQTGFPENIDWPEKPTA